MKLIERKQPGYIIEFDVEDVARIGYMISVIEATEKPNWWGSEIGLAEPGLTEEKLRDFSQRFTALLQADPA